MNSKNDYKHIGFIFLFLFYGQLYASAANLKTTVDEIVRPLLEFRPQSALVVGVIKNGEQHIYSYGQLSYENTQPPDAGTVFEIGSLTKAFTGILFSEMVLSGEVGLDDPIQMYLPDTVNAPTWGDRAITLHDLAKHSSGLPRLPDNIHSADPENPYADYTVQQLYDYLISATLNFEPGTQVLYSNLGSGLLGHLLAVRAGTDYDSLLHTRVLAPLEMVDTAITFTPSMLSRLSPGYKMDGLPCKNWDLPEAVAGAGAIRSTMNDMMKFLSANLGMRETTIQNAIDFSQQLHLRENNPIDNTTLLGWDGMTIPIDDLPCIWKNGQTGGYRSFIGFQREQQIGIVAIVNQAVEELDYVGVDIFMSLAGLTPVTIPFPKYPQEVRLNASIFDTYVGRYQLTPDLILTITRENDYFIAQLTGQSKFRLFPESEILFFAKAFDLKISFHEDENGKVAYLTLHQNGEHRANRMESSANEYYQHMK
ncbi:MAG: serine hydrolase [Candidatus Omnitrophota bacterium]|jgi:CubicO group peptidase (beta-lactamase class C family)|nr:MAG: serine hydrolase [Candidatus Omnitrophota bacterium]